LAGGYHRPMVAALYRPLRIEAAMLSAVGLVAATAVYCLSYNALAGRSENLGTAMIWAIVNVVPFFFAFEAAKRAGSMADVAVRLAAALAASMLLHILAFGFPADFGFQLVRRVPALLLVLGLLGGGRVAAAAKVAPMTEGAGMLPLPPGAVDWVSAAGNYVELRSAGRTVLHRAPLSHVHAQLERHGFVRIHRSTLVRREKIARVRTNDVILDDGTSLKTGKRYRSGLTFH
jgi:LytTr DNA-binding domain